MRNVGGSIVKFTDSLKKRVAKAQKKIVLPESNSRRVLRAAERIRDEEFARIILIGKPRRIVETAAKYQIDLNGIEIIDPETYPMLDKFSKYLVDRQAEPSMTVETARKMLTTEYGFFGTGLGSGYAIDLNGTSITVPELDYLDHTDLIVDARQPMTVEKARKILIEDYNFFGACLVAFDIVDGMVSGAATTSFDVIHAGLQVIGMHPGTETLTSSMIMITRTPQYGDNGIFVLGDCGVIMEPTATQLADIARVCASRARITAQILDPKVVFLSYSTDGSGEGPTVEKIHEAIQLLKEQNADFMYDGEMQVDAALSPQICAHKFPESKINGQANVLVFPNLNTANVCYKMMQRLAGATVLGPLFQGLAKPVMDVSRGCSVEEIVSVVAVCCSDAVFLEAERERDIAFTSRFEKLDKRVAVDQRNASIQFDPEKCKNCTLCRRRCAQTMSITDYYSLPSTGDIPICVHCGQCSLTCMFGATTTVSQVEKVQEAISDPNKVVIFQIAPAVRVALGEEFGLPFGSIVKGKTITALRKLGADYVFDTNFGADLTVMEEASEFLERLKNHKEQLPLFTSCCSSWVEFVEIYFPEIISHLATTRSPISSLSSIIKTYFAKKADIPPDKIVNVCVTPCTSKKSEILRPELNGAAHYWDTRDMRDTDLCITTRELAQWIKEKRLGFNTLEDSNYDSLLGEASGAGIIFGNSGGVMEAILRTAHFLHTGEHISEYFLHFEPIRGVEGIKTASVMFDDDVINVAAISGLANARKFINTIERRHAWKKYSLIEVMACPGGCIGGGGQPRTKLSQAVEAKKARVASLYRLDDECDIHASWENQELRMLYKDFLEGPLSYMSTLLLHTHFFNKHYMLGKDDQVEPKK
jgi:phosphate acetyltransferase